MIDKLSELNKQQFLPNFCTPNSVFSVLLIGELFAIILTLSAAGFSLQSWDVLALNSIYIQYNALSGIAFLCLLRKYISSYRGYTIASISYIGLLLLFLIISEISYQLINYLQMQSLVAIQSHWAFHLHNLIIGGIISGLALRYLYVQHKWKLQTQAEAQTHLQLLQARIHPHFLFNSMNTIASLTRSDAKLAEQVTIDLADLFRILFQQKSTLVSWEKELQIAQQYLHIESLRFGKRLKINWHIQPLPSDTKIPLLCLQPLLENAIYHGIEANIEGGEIDVIVELNHSSSPAQIEITISNTAAEKPKSRQGNQMAIKNIRQRLYAHYKSKAGLDIDDNKDKFTVRLFFPYQSKHRLL